MQSTITSIFPITVCLCLRCQSKSNRNICMCCLKCVHSAYRESLVCLFLEHQCKFISAGLFLSSLTIRTKKKMGCHGFSLGLMPFRAIGSKTLSCREVSFVHFQSQIKASFPLLFLQFSICSCVMTSLPVHLSVVDLVPSSECSNLPLLAYECCRVRSKSLSRFLLCSLHTSSSPRLSSSFCSFLF